MCDIIILNNNLLVVEDWRFTCVFFVMKSNSTVIMLSGDVWLSLLCTVCLQISMFTPDLSVRRAS